MPCLADRSVAVAVRPSPGRPTISISFQAGSSASSNARPWMALTAEPAGSVMTRISGAVSRTAAAPDARTPRATTGEASGIPAHATAAPPGPADRETTTSAYVLSRRRVVPNGPGNGEYLTSAYLPARCRVQTVNGVRG